jgi:hypothetical protein
MQWQMKPGFKLLDDEMKKGGEMESKAMLTAFNCFNCFN